eukprot:TRINITY_DN13696_c0_g1_i1.p1 TRINITY_DN13696_c0_g1~~TRINITY_DN13696_c0_g1_i1.p1  ORF type:complete len:108 (-),score=6.65 TRINITY_DN13696_c0_g1_i1:144-467(-)
MQFYTISAVLINNKIMSYSLFTLSSSIRLKVLSFLTPGDLLQLRRISNQARTDIEIAAKKLFARCFKVLAPNSKDECWKALLGFFSEKSSAILKVLYWAIGSFTSDN